MFYPWLILAVPILTITGGETKHRFLRWDCFECRICAPFAENLKCQIAGSRQSVLNVEVNLLKSLPSIRTYVKISTRSKPSEQFRKLFDFTFNGCRVISDVARGKTMVSRLYNAVVRTSNQPRKCPIKQGFIYYRNISMEEVYPSFFPESSIEVQVELFHLKKSYFNITLRGDISSN
ncbi:uncharacterized protein LOC117892641 [Drosophila subobscura]|uniref:uncharacterized protein LOC117892641 n=1 Tax=Drosophila subobscura TaxID=7241 RepID=UPI00155A7E33|nr:uncharacterized protein LOC117892641 [Drosophila subobscura]